MNDNEFFERLAGEVLHLPMEHRITKSVFEFCKQFEHLNTKEKISVTDRALAVGMNYADMSRLEDYRQDLLDEKATFQAAMEAVGEVADHDAHYEPVTIEYDVRFLHLDAGCLMELKRAYETLLSEGFVKAFVKEETYVPSPEDTKYVLMTREMWSLADNIAERAYEDWRQARIAEGKTSKELPTLEKKWSELTDEEKASTMNQAVETVKFVEKRFGLEKVLSGEVDKEQVIEAIAENAHEVWADEKMNAGWIYGEKRDNEAKRHPMLIPYKDVPESEREYDRNYGREFVSSLMISSEKLEFNGPQITDEEAMRVAISRDNAALGTIDTMLQDKGEVYGLPFDIAVGYANDVMKRLSEVIGWNSEKRNYNFEGFSGHYLSYDVQDQEQGIAWIHGNEVVCTFFPKADGSLGMQFDEPVKYGYTDNINPWYVISDLMNGKHILDKENLFLASQECHYGNELVYGVRFGDSVAFAYDGNDINLNRQLTQREANVRFVAADTLSEALQGHVDMIMSHQGFDTKDVEIVCYAYDGNKVRTEHELAQAFDERMMIPVGRGSIVTRNEEDWKIINHVNAELDAVRTELERKAGIPEGMDHFRFQNAVYPYSMRKDIFSLVSECGKNQILNNSIVDGTMVSAIPNGHGFFMKAPKRKVSADSFIGSMREKVLSEANVQKARQDFRLFLSELKSESQSQGRDRHR